MKKIFILFVFFISGCLNLYDNKTYYSYECLGEPYKDIKGIVGFYIEQIDSVSKAKAFILSSFLSSSNIENVNIYDNVKAIEAGYKVDSSRNGPYFSQLVINRDIIDTQLQMPIVSNTGIDSLNTVDLGGGIYHTTVNYNNDIIGYKPISTKIPRICVYVIIRDVWIKFDKNNKPEPGKPLRTARVCTTGDVSDYETLTQSLNIFMQNNIKFDSKKFYECSKTTKKCNSINNF